MAESFSFNPEESRCEKHEGHEPYNYDVAVVLSAGWKKKPGEEGFEDNRELDIPSKIRVLAVGQLASEGRAKKIIFSGGKLFGKNISLAEGMESYFKRKFPDLDVEISLEEESIDTTENAKLTGDILKEQGIDTALLITSTTHMQRAQKLFEEQGLEIAPVKAEGEMARRSEHHDEYVNRYLGSCKFLTEEAKEYLLRSIMIFDKNGDFIKKVAKAQRGAE